MIYGTKKNLFFVIILVFILISVPFIKGSLYQLTADFFYPFIYIANEINEYVSEKADLWQSRANLVSQNSKLRKRNKELKAKSRYIEKLREKNAELRRLLQLKSTPSYKYIFSEIISRDPVNWYEQFTINKGIYSGIKEGAIVLSRVKNNSGELSFAVVGRVVKVSKRTSVVHTLLSQECKLSIMIPENGATGVLQGGGRTMDKVWSNIKFLPKELNYKAGMEVQTSGMTGITPPSLKIGKLISKDKEDIQLYNNLYYKAKMKPYIDFNHLNFVLIMKKK